MKISRTVLESYFSPEVNMVSNNSVVSTPLQTNQDKETTESLPESNAQEDQAPGINKISIPKVKPKNNPFRPSNSKDVGLTIIEHYLSYNAPYDINDPKDLASLVKCLELETGLAVTPKKYFDVITVNFLNRNQ